MTTKITATLIDDLDGGEADRTVRFGFEKKSYEIDLNLDNVGRLQDALQPFTANARKATNGHHPPRRRTVELDPAQQAGPIQPASNHDIRTWAKSQQMKVNERGRIPRDILDAYTAAR